MNSLARVLDDNLADKGDGSGLRKASVLCAPLAAREGTFGPDKAELVERFRSQAAMAIQNFRRTDTLHARTPKAERKHAMAELARSVFHDPNNALRSVAPLVQQMQEGVRSGRVEPGVFRADLEQLLKSLEVCRRIFGGMLTFARPGAGPASRGRV